MRNDPFIAFVDRTLEPPALEIRVNFGLVAGRQATPAEIDDLASQLLPDVGEVSIVAEDRHEISDRAEAALHQVRVEVAGTQLPGAELETAELTGRLLAICERWAQRCADERRVDVAGI